MDLGEGCDSDREVACGARELDELDRIGEVALLRALQGSELEQRIAELEQRLGTRRVG